MSNDIINSGLDKEKRKKDNSIIKILIITQAITVLIIYIFLYLFNLNIVKYVLIFDMILFIIFVLNLRAGLGVIRSKLRSTGSRYAIFDAILCILTILSSNEFMERFEKEGDSILVLLAIFASVITIITIIFVLSRAKRDTYLKDISYTLIIGIIYNLLDGIETLPEDIKSLVRLFLGIFFTGALVKLILDIFGISLPAVITLLGANKAAIILAGILQMAFWKNESIIQDAFGLEDYQMKILFILSIPITVCFELAIEVSLKRLYALISKKLRLSENYKSFIYLIMSYILVIFMIATGLVKEDLEKYIFNMFLNPFVIIVLIIIAIIPKYIHMYLRTHTISLKKGIVLILSISAILALGYYAYLQYSEGHSEPANDAYAIMVNYNGSWIGSIYEGTNRTDITGTGNPKVPIKVTELPIIIDIQKIDGDYGILTVDILKNDEKINTGTAQAGHTGVRIILP